MFSLVIILVLWGNPGGYNGSSFGDVREITGFATSAKCETAAQVMRRKNTSSYVVNAYCVEK
jgi:hypothetical protein